MAAKQIYASHYFEAVFDLTAIVEDARLAGHSGIYLVVLRRFRFDDLPSGGVVNVRSRVLGKMREHMRSELEQQKQSSEQAYRSPTGNSR